MLHAYPDAGRAFIATYQKLGYLTPDALVVLSPGRQIETWRLNARQELVAREREPATLVARAVAAYQDAARRTRDGLLRHIEPEARLRLH